MNSDEEELQQAIENDALSAGDGLEAHAYREVFRVLKKPVAGPLPAGFAERVTQKIVRRQKQAERRDYLWFAAGVLLLGVAGLGTIAYTGFRLDWGFLQPLSDYRGLCLFAVVFILFLNWLDQRFIRNSTADVNPYHGGNGQ